MSQRLDRLFASRKELDDLRQTNKNLAYERRVVRKVLSAFEVPKYEIAAEASMYESEDNQDVFLTFSWMQYKYPQLPVRLVAHEIWKPSLVDFVRYKKRNNKLWNTWKEVHKSMGSVLEEGLVLACVFPTPAECALGDMVIWTGELTGADDVDYVGLFLQSGNQDTVIMESFEQFLTRLVKTCVL